jgi:hypothetical protein
MHVYNKEHIVATFHVFFLLCEIHSHYKYQNIDLDSTDNFMLIFFYIMFTKL